MKPEHCCKHLRTKKMYVPEQEDQVFTSIGEELTFHGHCWCNRTLTEVGFDDGHVGVQLCNPSRPCFES
jgi:heat shock protein HslJ